MLGKNWRRRPFGLSVESKMAALAAGDLYVRGIATRLLFSGGHTAGRNHPSEAAAMWDYCRRHFPPGTFQSEDVHLEEESIDTADNAERVALILAERGWHHVGLLTVSYHLTAASSLFLAYGAEMQSMFASDTVLLERSLRHRRYLARYHAFACFRSAAATEHIRRAVLVLDPRGMRLRRLTRLLRRL